MTEYKLLLTQKNFVLLWISQMFSQLTLHIINFLLITSLYKSTGSTIAISLVWVFFALPVIFVGPIASAGVDLFDKKKLLMTTNLLQSVLIFSYAFTHQTSVFLLYGVVFTYSLINQFYVPTEMAALPFLVSKKELPVANSLLFLTQQSAIVFGFGFASILFGKIGLQNALFFSSALLLIAFLSTTFLSKNVLITAKNGFEKSFTKFFVHMFEGYKYLKKNKLLLAPLLLIIGLQVTLAVAFTNMPIISEELLNVPAENAGLLLAVPAGVGAGIGALLIPRALKTIRKITVIRHSLQLIVLSLFSLVFLPEFSTENGLLILGIVTISLLGFSFVGVLIPSQTFLQEYTPEDLRGRVFGGLWFLTTIFTVFPILVSATIAEILGINILIFIVGTVSMATYLVLRNYAEKLVYNSKIKQTNYEI